jgi:V8-like Glu-specific endopeptidase
LIGEFGQETNQSLEEKVVTIKSVSKLLGSLQAIELDAALPEPRMPGSPVCLPDETSLAEQHIVVRGRRSALESVIGDVDDRTRILETKLTPWRQICALDIEGKNGARFIGTGWLAGPRTVVTAGHCVHHPDLGGWAERITVSPARGGGGHPSGSRCSLSVLRRSHNVSGVFINERQQYPC